MLNSFVSIICNYACGVVFKIHKRYAHTSHIMCCIGEYKFYARLHTHTHALFHFQHNSINTYYDRRTQHRRRLHPQSHIKMTLLLCHQPSPHTPHRMSTLVRKSPEIIYTSEINPPRRWSKKDTHIQYDGRRASCRKNYLFQPAVHINIHESVYHHIIRRS